MPDNKPFTFNDGAGEIPARSAVIMVAARFFFDSRIYKISSIKFIENAFNKEKERIRVIIGNTIIRVYGRHGLKSISNSLKSWASNPKNIDVNFVGGPTFILMTAEWKNPLPYSCIHMWGGNIPRTYLRRRGNTPSGWWMDITRKDPKLGSIHIDARPYIWLDNVCLNLIERIVSMRIASELTAQYVRRRRIERKAPIEGAIRPAAFEKLTRHRARRKLWKSNRYTQSEARKIVEVLWGNPAIKAIIESLIRDVQKGYRILRGIFSGRGGAG